MYVRGGAPSSQHLAYCNLDEGPISANVSHFSHHYEHHPPTGSKEAPLLHLPTTTPAEEARYV